VENNALDAQTVPALKALLRAYGLSVAGRKADLVQRLASIDLTVPPAPGAAAAEAPTKSSGGALPKPGLEAELLAGFGP
jgi:hypothetical protein